MGCYNLTCAISNLPICWGDEIVAFILLPTNKSNKRNYSCYPDAFFVPAGLPVVGKYDDYGGIEEIKIAKSTEEFLKQIKFYTKNESGDSVSPYQFDNIDELMDNIERGEIFIKDSYGSFPIKDSTKLTQLYYKREDQYRKIENKISFDKLEKNDTIPNNFCGYLDVGFSLNLRDTLKLQKLFFDADIDKIVKVLKESNNKYNVTKVGYSLVISLGECDISRGNQKLLFPASMYNFIEIMADGCVKFRIVISSKQDTNIASIGQIPTFEKIFEDIYKIIFVENFLKKIISAYKYEHLVVLK